MPNYIIQPLTGINTTEAIQCNGENIPDAIKKRFSVNTVSCKKNEIGDADFMIKRPFKVNPVFYKIKREKGK